MTTKITFNRGMLHENARETMTEPYMDLEIVIDDKYGGSFSGYVDARASKLIQAAPALLEALTEMGDWLAYGLSIPDGTEPTAEDLERCKRISAKGRAAIAMATE